MNELAKKLAHIRAEGRLPAAELNAKVALALLFCDPGMTGWAMRAGLRDVTARLLTHDFTDQPHLDEMDFKRWVLGLPGNGVQAVAGAVYPVVAEPVPDESPDELLEVMALRFTAHLSAITHAL